MFRHYQRATVFLGVFLFASLVSRSQAPSTLEFEVATVKPAAPYRGWSGLHGGPGTAFPGRITGTNVTLKLILENAYDVLDDQIVGPAWLASEHYDIAATLPSATTKEQFRVMLQNLVTERFQLTLHRERKDFVVYRLVVAKDGPKLKASRGGSGAVAAKATAKGRARTDDRGFPQPPARQTAQTQSRGVAMMAGNQITMGTLAQFLKFPLGFEMGGARPMSTRVVDKTGLAGEYDVTLEYQWPGGAQAARENSTYLAPNIFVALQQQLGLKLEQGKEPLDVLVVDHAEKVPTEN